MRYEEREDGELLEFARDGWAPAFAVLVHRHGPALLTAFADEPDPVERTVEVFRRAMRHLPDHDPDDGSVEAWLFGLAGRPVPAEVRPPVEASLDHVWHEVDQRWPDGRRPPRRHPVLRGVAIAVGAVALGVAVPTIVLGLPPSAGDGEVETVRAQPLEEPPPEEPEPEELPEFEFPDVGDPATAPEPEPVAPVEEPAPVEPVAPPAPAAPAPPPPTTGDPGGGTTPPEPAPEPEPTAEPPPPAPEPPPATDGDVDGGGGTDDGSLGAGGDA